MYAKRILLILIHNLITQLFTYSFHNFQIVLKFHENILKCDNKFNQHYFTDECTKNVIVLIKYKIMYLINFLYLFLLLSTWF